MEVFMQEQFKRSLEALLSNRWYVVINQNPLAGRRLDIEFPKPGPVEVMLSEDHFSFHDDYGTWCSNIPYSIDSYKGELKFVVHCWDDRDKDPSNRFIRTVRFVRSPSDPSWDQLEQVFYKVYGKPDCYF